MTNSQRHLSVLALILVGCATAQPMPAPIAPAPAPAPVAVAAPAPAPAPAPATAPSPAVNPNSEGASVATPAEPAKTEASDSVLTTPDASEAPRRQSPIDVLTARDVAFLADYANSEARARAETECNTDSKGDLAAKGECLEKARDKFKPDVLRFRKDPDGRLALVIYKRNGNTLRELCVSSIEFTDVTEDSVNLKFTGREKGARPLFRSGSRTVRVPNDYSIEIDDPQFGKMSYSAKIGLVDSQ
jgi:hypothetical protein